MAFSDRGDRHSRRNDPHSRRADRREREHQKDLFDAKFGRGPLAGRTGNPLVDDPFFNPWAPGGDFDRSRPSGPSFTSKPISYHEGRCDGDSRESEHQRAEPTLERKPLPEDLDTIIARTVPATLRHLDALNNRSLAKAVAVSWFAQASELEKLQGVQQILSPKNAVPLETARTLTGDNNLRAIIVRVDSLSDTAWYQTGSRAEQYGSGYANGNGIHFKRRYYCCFFLSQLAGEVTAVLKQEPAFKVSKHFHREANVSNPGSNYSLKETATISQVLEVVQIDQIARRILKQSLVGIHIPSIVQSQKRERFDPHRGYGEESIFARLGITAGEGALDFKCSITDREMYDMSYEKQVSADEVKNVICAILAQTKSSTIPWLP